MKKRLLIALCCLVLLLQMLPIVSMAETVDKGAVPNDLYYCREALKTLENSEALLFAYDSIVAGIDACAEEITVSNNQYQISPAEFEMVLEATRRDHTEQFWMGSVYTPIHDGEVFWSMKPTYTMTGAELQDAKAAFEQAISLMLARLTPEMSEYEMEKALHDMLASQIVYDGSSPNAHNAYGALVEGRAVCEGYAESLQCLLHRVGIQSVEIFGYGINPTTGIGEPHAWNAVRIDGEYYLVDLTWNDQQNVLLHAYFNQTTQIMSEDHTQWIIGQNANNEILTCEVFDLPVCTATEANYFTKAGLRIQNYTVNSIGKLLKENGLSVNLFIDSDLSAFKAWYEQNIVEIAGAAGVSGKFLYGTTHVGREIRIYIETCQHTNVTLVEAKPATCDADGNTAYISCKDCQKIFLTEKDVEGNYVEIVNRDSVKILSIGHNWSVRDTENEAALVSRATNCQEHDTYWYVCASCGEMSDTYTFTTVAGAHVDANGDEICDLCGDGEQPFDFGAILDFILANPIILGGGGGAILLAIIIAIISKVRG